MPVARESLATVIQFQSLLSSEFSRVFFSNECINASTTRIESQSTHRSGLRSRARGINSGRTKSRRPLAPREMHVDFHAMVSETVVRHGQLSSTSHAHALPSAGPFPKMGLDALPFPPLRPFPPPVEVATLSATSASEALAAGSHRDTPIHVC